MSVRIRMQRLGRRNRAFFRICATDQRCPRNGKTLENLGFYDPLVAPGSDGVRLKIDEDRVRYWLSVGAQPSETVASLLKQGGIALPQKKKRVRNRPKKAGGKKA